MSYTITQESFANLTSYWSSSSYRLKWDSVFVLPAWLEVWWREFQPQAELYLTAVRQDADIIGIAPLQIKENRASFIGSADVCDYIDFVVVPGRETDFFNVLFDDFKGRGVNQLELRPLRPDSTVLTHLVDIARSRKYEVLCHEEEVSVEMDLPSTWDEYLEILSRKQRHEVRRKLRRLWEEGNVDYRCIEASGEEVGKFMDTFLRLFSLSREEKANFMTPQKESFFRSLAGAMAEIGLLRFGIIEIDELPTSIIMGFDYNDTVYLYNSGYDPQYSSLSVGLLCKVLGLKESIASGRKKWDFLKGGEPYKYLLGGREIPIYSCRITLE
ncbi:GNAT family N-acetyltransferase [Chloroflexota bacterium]